MSIASSQYAEYANKVKDEWHQKLLIAYMHEDWEQVDAVIFAMKKFHFAE